MTQTPDAPQKIWIYDTTLRDGAQREGISLSLEDKIRIARQLDALGIPFIEGGWPGANPKDVQFFWQIQEQPLKNSELVAFCSTRRPDRRPEDDELLTAILSAGTRWVTLFGKSWDLHVSAGLKTTLDENLAMIKDSIAYLRSQGRRLIYDAEHWFDGYKHNPEYALKTLGAAIEAGAEWLTLCDTNGGCLSHEITAIVAEVCKAFDLQVQPPDSLDPSSFDGRPRLGIHTHNDSETAVANAIAAVMGGATMVQGTINGYGERCGNANLCSLIPNLQLKLGYHCIAVPQLTQLTRSSRLISEIANLAPNDHAAFVGLSAFAHKGGIHVSAVERNPLTYEHIPPETIGNSRRIVVSDQSGLSNILAKARTFGIELDKKDPVCRQILTQLKELENQGYQFEAAEASFDLLMREAMGNRPSFFGLKGFQVHCVTQDDGSILSLATIKVQIKGQNILEAGEGNGPVSALDVALRRAIVQFYPQVQSFHLTDYKVRVLGGADGPAARTRVLVESSDGTQHWSTVGVSYNIIEASYKAVVEGLEYGLLLHNIAPLMATEQPTPAHT